MVSIQKHKAEILLGILAILFVAGVLVWNGRIQKNYKHYNNTDITYVKGIVKEVSNDELEKDKTNDNRYLGAQKVKAEVLEGK